MSLRPSPEVRSLLDGACRGALLGAALGLAGCRANHAEPPATEAPPSVPQSAFAALVRSLETLDALSDPRASIELRAVRSDSLVDHERARPYARVRLEVSVFAPDVASARRAFADAVHALEAEAAAEGRLESVTSERGWRVFQGMDWQAAGTSDGPDSYSDVISVEVRPGREARALALAGDPALAAEGSASIESYVRVAAAESSRIGQVALDLTVKSPTPHERDFVFRVRPVDPDAHFTRAQIGDFLRELEARSPAARLTHVAIERAPHHPDLTSPDGWTFEAELTLRQRS